MDLKFNGQYRMMELSRFHFVRECIDDILLVPAVMEKLFQIQVNNYWENNVYIIYNVF